MNVCVYVWFGTGGRLVEIYDHTWIISVMMIDYHLTNGVFLAPALAKTNKQTFLCQLTGALLNIIYSFWVVETWWRVAEMKIPTSQNFSRISVIDNHFLHGRLESKILYSFEWVWIILVGSRLQWELVFHYELWEKIRYYQENAYFIAFQLKCNQNNSANICMKLILFVTYEPTAN